MLFGVEMNFCEDNLSGNQLIQVLLFGDSLLPIIGTSGGAVQTLAQALIMENEKSRKLQIDTICFDDIKAREFATQLSFTSVKFITKKHFKSSLFERVYSFVVMSVANYRLLSDSYDCILIEGAPVKLLPFLVSHKARKVISRVVFHVHNRVRRFYGTKKLLNNLLLVAPSLFTIASIGNCCKTSPRLQPTVVKNCVYPDLSDALSLSWDRDLARKDLGVKKDEFLIIYAGRIVEEKGCLDLLNALSLLEPSFKLLFVGSSFFSQAPRTEFEQIVSQKAESLGNRVVFTGYIEHAYVGRYYKMADLCVMPSKCDEAAGLVAIEALSMGTPVVATNRGGIPEYLSPYCVKLLDPEGDFVSCLAEEIKRVKDNYEAIKESTRAISHLVAESYSAHNYYEEMVDCISRVAPRALKRF